MSIVVIPAVLRAGSLCFPNMLIAGWSAQISTPTDCGGGGQACDDSNPCTSDFCMDGVCRHVDSSACANPVCSASAGCPIADGDGDGLNDTWESNGYIDLNCNGVFDAGDAPLPDADPAVPDVYVAYDWMAASGRESSHEPTAEALQMVIDSFAGAGIRLHFDPPPGPIPHHQVITFGPPPVCAGSDAVDFYEIKAAHFDPRKRFTHRYAIFGHYVNCDSKAGCAACAAETGTQTKFQTSGMAEVFGNDFVVSLADFEAVLAPDLPPTKRNDLLSRWQAGTMAHELGHTFGLDHGGGFDPTTKPPSQKPNYVSVMNHSYQFAGISTADTPGSITPTGPPRVDFSHGVSLTLDENHLDEASGIAGSPCGGLDIITYYCPDGVVRPGPGCGPIDWNRISPDTEPDVASDINGDGLLSSDLAGFDDWSFVRSHLAFQCGENFTDGPSSPRGSVASDEQDFETARLRHVLFPILVPRIDVRPGCPTNRIFLGDRLPVFVTLFGSEELDVMKIAPSSLRFAGAAPAGTFRVDLDGDRRLDLVAAFRSSNLNLTPRSTSATLTGHLNTSQAFAGTDSVVVLSGRPKRPGACP